MVRLSWQQNPVDRAGFCFVEPETRRSKYLPQTKLEAHVSIISSTSRTTLVQTFVNPFPQQIPELRYSFPLHDGVSVVGFTCTIGDRVIRGIVKEKQEAREIYQQAVSRGETAGLLEQLPESSDVFTTTIGHVPASAKLEVNITYLGELKHDAQVDGIRLTIPTSIAPRYGSHPGELARPAVPRSDRGMTITVDAEVPGGSHISSIQSPSHPLTVTLGRTSISPDAEPSSQRASATLTLRTAELKNDVIVLVKATKIGEPLAILEEHPTIPNQRALMVTLVPRFALPDEKPEIVFVCDRSGSMSGKIVNLQAALHLFIKSLRIGTKFNICSFGSHFTFLWDRSRTYNQSSVQEAIEHIDTFDANYGGTEMYEPIEDTFKHRSKDMNLEVFLLTDGAIWDQVSLIDMVNKYVAESDGAIRVFTLGIGSGASTSLIEGVARAGNGFSQAVGDTEDMGSKVVRMLKGAMFPHIKDYSLEIKYDETSASDADDFMVIDNDTREYAPSDSTTSPSTAVEEEPMATISLFNTSIDQDVEMSGDTGTSADDRCSQAPIVSPPKALQAPFSIPPLFPFSRTSVYILLSAESTPQQKPKSVIVHGTSTYGPLELEIPVASLEAKGETVHQLAAKKSISELEEGRGWIFHAKDERSGELFQKKYDGMFQDMVEREAVRLGVLYQVGGKWCSFVAVEDNNYDDRRGEGGSGEASNINHGDGQSFENQLDTVSGTLKSRVAQSTRLPATDRSGLPQQMAQKSQPLQGTFHQTTRFASKKRSDAMGNVGSFGSVRPLPPGTTAQQRFGVMGSRSQSTGQSRTSPPIIVAAALMSPAPIDQALMQMYQKEMQESASMPLPDEEDDDLTPAIMTASEAQAPRRSQPQTPPQKLQRLITLQTFTGSWAMSDEIMEFMGWEWEEISKARSSVPAGIVADTSELILTACIIAWIQREMSEQKDSWELFVEKAVAWMEDQVGGQIVKETLGKAARLV